MTEYMWLQTRPRFILSSERGCVGLFLLLLFFFFWFACLFVCLFVLFLFFFWGGGGGGEVESKAMLTPKNTSLLLEAYMRIEPATQHRSAQHTTD